MTSIIKKYKNPLIYLLTIIFVFLLWLVLSLLIDSSLILPSPVSSIKEIFYFFKEKSKKRDDIYSRRYILWKV